MKNQTIIIILAILLIGFLYIQKPKEPVSMTIHYYREGKEVYSQKNLFSMVTPPGENYDQISFDISATNTGNAPIKNMKIIDASPIELKNTLPATIKSLGVGESKILWSSGLIDTQPLEGQVVNFWVKVSGEEEYTQQTIYSEGNSAIRFEATGVYFIDKESSFTIVSGQCQYPNCEKGLDEDWNSYDYSIIDGHTIIDETFIYPSDAGNIKVREKHNDNGGHLYLSCIKQDGTTSLLYQSSFGLSTVNILLPSECLYNNQVTIRNDMYGGANDVHYYETGISYEKVVSLFLEDGQFSATSGGGQMQIYEDRVRICQSATIPNRKIYNTTFSFYRHGASTLSNPNRLLYHRIRRISDDSIIAEESMLMKDVTPYVQKYYTFNYNTPIVINENVRFCIEQNNDPIDETGITFFGSGQSQPNSCYYYDTNMGYYYDIMTELYYKYIYK